MVKLILVLCSMVIIGSCSNSSTADPDAIGKGAFKILKG